MDYKNYTNIYKNGTRVQDLTWCWKRTREERDTERSKRRKDGILGPYLPTFVVVGLGRILVWRRVSDDTFGKNMERIPLVHCESWIGQNIKVIWFHSCWQFPIECIQKISKDQIQRRNRHRHPRANSTTRTKWKKLIIVPSKTHTAIQEPLRIILKWVFPVIRVLMDRPCIHVQRRLCWNIVSSYHAIIIRFSLHQNWPWWIESECLLYHSPQIRKLLHIIIV